MFGYVRPVRCQLSPEERQAYDSVYCGLCHALARRYGPAWTFSLSYDLTFLALLLAALDGGAVVRQKRCLAHPLRGRPVLMRQRALQYAADASVLLTDHQARDHVRDESGGRRWAARMLILAARRARRRAEGRLPGRQEQFRAQLGRLHALEEAGSASLDETADCFGQMLQALAPSMSPAVERPLRQLLYHLGRWIYLIDACADLEEDGQRGRYNPVRARFALAGGLDEPARQQLALVAGQLAFRRGPGAVAAAAETIPIDFGAYAVPKPARGDRGRFYRAKRPIKERTMNEDAYRVLGVDPRRI